MKPLSKEFKKLQAKWYKKLERDGFDDIEQDEDHLKQWGAKLFKTKWKNKISWDTKEEYYQLAGQFLYEHKFETNFERKVWQLHSEGVSIRKMVPILKAKGFKTYRDNVHSTVKKLVEIMVKSVREK